MESVAVLVKLLKEAGVLQTTPEMEMFESASEGPIRLLARRRMINEIQALKALSDRLKISYLDLDDPEVEGRLDPSVRLESNGALCWKHKCLPLYKEHGAVVVAVTDPLERDALRSLGFSLGAAVRPVLVEEAKLLRLLAEYSPREGELFDELDLGGDEGIEVQIISSAKNDAGNEGTELPPIIRLCNRILTGAIKEGASDIHIEPLSHGVDVRYRIEGEMQSILEVPRRLYPHLISRFKVLAGMDIAERRRPQDGRIRAKFQDEWLDLRVSSVPTAAGEKLVLRLLKSDATKLTFDKLSLPADIVKKLHTALRGHGRLLLATGPTGSGKTTTLYTCLNYLQDGSRNIETVEDPIEYRMAGISQIPVNEAIGVTFASALRSILRQDPDVIMVGEIRDPETAGIALQAAQTGHLVLSTLHTNDAPSAVVRLQNLGVDGFTIASGLAGVLAQRLVRRNCEECSDIDTTVPDGVLEQIQRRSRTEIKLVAGRGCKSCRYSGFRGRVGVFSYLEITESVERLIHERAPLAKIVEQAKREGYRDLEAAAVDLLFRGLSRWSELEDYIRLDEVQQEPEALMPEVVAPPPVVVASPAERPGIRRKKVLIVEDDPDMRSLFTLVLRREMYEVIEAENGLVGLHKVYEENPDLILCDLMMPVMDGREFLSRMQSTPETRGIPIVVLTAANSEANEISLLELGAREFLGKTSSPSVIATRLRRILKGE